MRTFRRRGCTTSATQLPKIAPSAQTAVSLQFLPLPTKAYPLEFHRGSSGFGLFQASLLPSLLWNCSTSFWGHDLTALATICCLAWADVAAGRIGRRCCEQLNCWTILPVARCPLPAAAIGRLAVACVVRACFTWCSVSQVPSFHPWPTGQAFPAPGLSATG